MSTFTIFVILIIFVAFLLVTVIMVQNPQGGGLSASFGGGGQQMGGVKKTSDFLDKSTWTLAIILLALILLSNISLMTGGTASQSDLFDNNDAIPTQTIPAPTDADIDATLNTEEE
ncbi:MAG TPA: preprotein translocase subunit SecG [Flavobacteriaceae bacterium]|nr:preprotein translocase subunit SecG [Flavobacteriaceae bacterium]